MTIASLPALGGRLVAPAQESATGTAAAAPSRTGPDLTRGPWREFDFWIGTWNCTNVASDTAAGTNRIESIQNGAALQEHWQGAGGGGGTSLNAYDYQTKQWHQTWVDDRGGVLFLSGGLDDDSNMVLEGTRPAQGGGEAQHRITWTPMDDGRVRQTWVVSTDSGKSWTTAADLYYARAE